MTQALRQLRALLVSSALSARARHASRIIKFAPLTREKLVTIELEDIPPVSTLR